MNRRILIGLILFFVASLGIYTFATTTDDNNIDNNNNNEETEKDTIVPVITLNGNPIEYVTVGSTFIDPGATATDNVDGEISDEITTGGTVDTNTVGSYELTYDVTDKAGNTADTVTRTVIVSDPEAPVIRLNGEREITIEVFGTYIEEGTIVTDNYDTNLTAVITGEVNTSILGTYQIRYNAVDSNNNIAVEIIRTINVVDTTKPVISLNDDELIILEVLSDTYTEYGATVTDNYDNNLTVTIGGDTVNTGVIGTYNVTYNATDNSGNNADEVIRTVKVIEAYPNIVSISNRSDHNKEFEAEDRTYDPTATLTIKDELDGESTYTIDSICTNEINQKRCYTIRYRPWDNGNSNIVPKYISKNEVDLSVLGKYRIDYYYTDSTGHTSYRYNFIYVKDETAPTLTVTPNYELTYEVFSDTPDWTNVEKESFDNSNDPLSGLIIDTSKVNMNKVGSFDVIYTVKETLYDKKYNGNDRDLLTSNKVIITINIVDETEPTIKLKGDNPVRINPSLLYFDKGATATDNYDGNITNKIKRNSNVKPYEIGEYEVKYTVTDSSGNTTTATRQVIVEDTIKPTILFLPGFNLKYKQNHSVFVSVLDNYKIDNNSLKYQWADSNETPNEESFVNSFNNFSFVDSSNNLDGSYYLWILAKDTSGNTTITRSGRFNFDNTAPIVDVEYDITTPTREKVTVTIKANEKIQESTGWILSNDKLSMTKQYDNNVTNDLVVVKDLLGNETTTSITIENIDRKNAEVFISSTSGSVAKNHNISIYATDESGIAHLKYDWFKEETGITRGEITTRIVNNEINPNFVNQPEDPNGTYYLWVYVKDNAQNRRHFKVGPFEFDNEAPKNIEVTSTPSSFTNGSVTLTVTAEDNYGVEAYQFNDNEWQTLNSFEFDNNQEVIIRVRDIVGNIGTTTFNIENIDKEGPKTFNFSPKMLKTLEVKQLFNINDITVTAYDTEDKDNHLASIVSIGYDQDGGNKFIEVNNIDTSKIGKYRICYKATDHAGNEGEKCVTLKVDVPDQHAYNETQGKLHTSLRVALRDAKPNDRIIVGSGIYNNDFIIDKDGIVLKSLNGINNTLVNGSFTITSDNVTLEGFHIKARSNYKTTPVIHMIDIKNVSILNNKVESWYKTTNQSAIGTYTGPANITGIIKGNTVEGAIGVGTDGNLEVSNNTVTGAAHEGIWFYPIANTAKLVIKNNIVTNQGAGFSQLKIVSRPTSINNRTDDIAMYNILFNNNKALDSIKLDWIVTENIQTAINNAVPGSKIYIAPGTYNEALLINKEGISLQAIGEVIISPNNISTAAITITANDVIVNGFNIKNSYAGLFVTNNANNVMISNNNISDSINGVAIHKYASDITINKNVISNIIDYGIVIGFNNDNNPIFATGIKITNNTITNTGKDGIYADYLSSNNRYLNNIIIGSGGNGIHLYKSNNDVIRNNIIQNSLANGISLMGSYKNSILNNEIINNNQYGIEIRFSYGTGNPSDNGGNIIRNNTIQNNDNNNTQIYEYAKEGYENEYGRNKSTGNNFGNAINPIISEFEENKAIIIE